MSNRQELIDDLRDIERKLQAMIRRLWWRDMLLNVVVVFSLIVLMLGILQCL